MTKSRFVRAISGEWWSVAMIAAALPHPTTGVVLAVLTAPVRVPLAHREGQWETVETIVIAPDEWTRVND